MARHLLGMPMMGVIDPTGRREGFSSSELLPEPCPWFPPHFCQNHITFSASPLGQGTFCTVGRSPASEDVFQLLGWTKLRASSKLLFITVVKR